MSCKIHGELRLLGFDVSERTVSRYLRGLRRRPGARQSWLTFLRNHREAIAAMDLFVVFTVSFRLLYAATCTRCSVRSMYRPANDPAGCSLGAPRASVLPPVPKPRPDLVQG